MAGAPSPSAPPALDRAPDAAADLAVGPRPGRPLPQLEVAAPLTDATGPAGGVGALAGPSLLVVPVGAPARGKTDDDDASGTPAEPVLGPAGQWVATRTGLDLGEVCRLARWRAGAGSTLPLHGARLAGDPRDADDAPVRVLLLGIGSGSAKDLRRAGAALARAARGLDRVSTPTADLDAAGLRAFVEGLLLGAWAPPRTGIETGPEPAVRTVVLLGAPEGAPGEIAAATISATATWRVRDLAATPSSTKTPDWVAGQARALVAAAAVVPGSGTLTATVLDEVELAQRRAGGLLAVGAASQHPPCLVRIDWTPADAAAAARGRAVLVGKGITFDTGGLALKPRESMVAMKTDMAGAAVVLATAVAAAETGLPRPVTALLPLAENSLGAASYRPGDVIRVLDGTTVEVDNPDAEGRLVLADALALADATLDPALLIDVATLTGAATLGLGRQHAALFTEDDALAEALTAAGQATGERIWRMPLVEEYRASLDSDVADLRHVPSSPAPGAGSVTAALFLREFAGARRWAHLDIAGVGRSEKESHEVPRGATGWGARVLLRLLEDLP
ncbi:leucyl aminopeptidase [Quadrisphaera granulorum]|uniref:Probable cytosol aminopeptidase n=1 Tax=Quadrisphaera granulorum TaxID=317664 RepID=A0A316B115_9ACTN|nr:M17 family metallopeptidase [Quadrisphaera granulorum]PWJ56187.1 leucyl aminopeptidase [Quadrisphaera granulorum]SZE94821.1 leucyl aminopeptidase [Quadrisphaera granulorum]